MVTVINTGRTETIENRRNLVTNPRLRTTSGWSVYTTTATVTPVSSGLQIDVTGPIAAGSNVLYPLDVILRTPSEKRSSALVIEVPPGFPAVSFRLLTQGYSPSFVLGESGAVIVNSGEVSQIVAPQTQSAASIGVRPLLRADDTIPAGARFILRDALVEPVEIPGSPFSGASAAASPFSYTWAGAANASESIEWLTRPVEVVPVLVDGYEATREAKSVVHEVVNKTFPDVTLRAPGPRKGQLRMLFKTEAEAVAAYAVLSVPQVFTISDIDLPGIAMPFVVAEGDLLIGLDDETRQVWWVQVPFVEVAP